jgi:hypothetical protein
MTIFTISNRADTGVFTLTINTVARAVVIDTLHRQLVVARRIRQVRRSDHFCMQGAEDVVSSVGGLGESDHPQPLFRGSRSRIWKLKTASAEHSPRDTRGNVPCAICRDAETRCSCQAYDTHCDIGNDR